jgi:hypothetical protein
LGGVAQLAQDNNPVDALPHLRKGALIAQDLGAYEELELDEESEML